MLPHQGGSFLRLQDGEIGGIRTLGLGEIEMAVADRDSLFVYRSGGGDT
jgi:hypothetical protein